MATVICSSTSAGQIVDILDADAAGVDQFEEPAFPLDQMGHAIARDAGHVVDDGQPPAGQPIEDAGFADIRSTDDSNLRNRHSGHIIV